VNDADFEMLARQSGGAFDAWLRSQALGHAIAWCGDRPTESVLMLLADKFYDYLKGDADENLRRQDER